MNSIRALTHVPALKASAEACLALTAWQLLAADPGTVAGTEGTPATQMVQRLASAAQLLLETLDATLPEQSDDTVSIRLPWLQDLQELADVVRDLQVGVAQPVNLLFGAVVRFQNLDTGSSWIEIAVQCAPVLNVGTAAGGMALAANQALKFLGGLVDIGFKFAQGMQRWRLAQLEIGLYAKQKELLETLAQEAIDHHKSQASKDVNKLVKDHAPDGTSEELKAEASNAALNGAVIIAALLERAVAFYPKVLEAPAKSEEQKSVQASWPKPEEVRSLLSVAAPALLGAGESGERAIKPKGE